LSFALTSVSPVQPSRDAPAPSAHGKPGAPEEFEAFVMQSFIQEMLPKGADNVFGKGIAGDIWRSMLAEKLAYEVAARGDLGIAQAVAQDAKQPATVKGT
jgi:peptidoglycan hydrolase FlgJ